MQTSDNWSHGLPLMHSCFPWCLIFEGQSMGNLGVGTGNLHLEGSSQYLYGPLMQQIDGLLQGHESEINFGLLILICLKKINGFIN